MRFAEVGRSIGNRVLESVGRAASRVQEKRPLSTDVLESDDAYLVVFDAPGASQSDVQVRYAEGAIEVRIDRFREFFSDFEMRVPGRGMSLDGRASLPADADVDPQAANATLRKNGTLEVRVPKKTKSELDAGGRTVEISTPDASDADDVDEDREATDEEPVPGEEEYDPDEDPDFSAADEGVDVGDETDPLESGTGTDPEDFHADEDADEESDRDET